MPSVLALSSVFGKSVTRDKVNAHKEKVVAIFNTDNTVNFISSQLARKFKMAPKLNNLVFYGTEGLSSTQLLILFRSPLPLWEFGADYFRCCA